MKNFHPLSFAAGLASGILVLVLIAGGMRLMSPRQRGFAGGAPNISRMAERMGMTETDLQKEIDSGKTMQEIAAEHGVQFGGGGNGGFRGGFVNAASSGAMRSSESSTGSDSSVSSASALPQSSSSSQ